jgi:chromosome partitioning protein
MDLQLATKFGHGDIQAKIFLTNALKALSAQYDFILIDCPPNIYLATQNGLFASNHYVVVVLAEYLSINRSISSCIFLLTGRVLI